MHITKDRLMHAIKKYVIHGLARYYRASRVLLYFEKGRVGQAQRLLLLYPYFRIFGGVKNRVGHSFPQ